MRLISGIVATLVGITLAVLAFMGVGAALWMYLAAGVFTACGVFQIYEGWAGWCALRAMGVKTPL